MTSRATTRMQAQRHLAAGSPLLCVTLAAFTGACGGPEPQGTQDEAASNVRGGKGRHRDAGTPSPDSGAAPSDAGTTNPDASVAPSDTVRPSVSLLAPRVAGKQVTGSITVSALAGDDNGVTRVDFFRDGEVAIGSATEEPYAISFDTSSVPDGAHAFFARATDGVNVSTSAVISISVSNAQPPAEPCAADNKVDLPASILEVAVRSAMKMSTRLSEVNDSSRYAAPFYGVLTESTGALRSVYMECAIPDFYNTSYDGLKPSARYRLTAISQDGCGNYAASASVPFETPPLATESNPPTASALKLINVGYWNATTSMFDYRPTVAVYIDDDTATGKVELFANGGLTPFEVITRPTQIKSYTTGTGWVRYGKVPDALRGATSTFRAVVQDLFGNVTESSASLTIP